MLLSQLSQNPVFVGSSMRGAALGVGVSLKNFTVKYLLCASAKSRNQVDFCVNFSAVENIGDSISLKTLRPVFPRVCARFIIGLPVFSSEGGFIGKLTDLHFEDGVATRLFIDNGKTFSLTAVLACTDAVILKKEQTFPLVNAYLPPSFLIFPIKKRL